MIKTSLIAPTSLIENYGNQGDFHLALAHLFDVVPNEYEKKLVASGKPIYLDNGLFENGASVPLGELLRIVARIKPDYVFAPDVLYDSEETKENIAEIYNDLERMKASIPGLKTKLAGVPQADNMDDYLECVQWMDEDKRIDLIGLSILAIPKSYEKKLGFWDISMSRMICLEQLNEIGIKTDCHLLGAGSSYKDVNYAAENCSFVKSHDSSSAIWNAIQGHKINEDFSIEGGKTEVPVDFNWDQPLTPLQKDLLKNNIKNVLKATNHDSA